ncbi:MAG: L-seryl-tRNA(Sec) selenium transferase [Planctomycetes bacterium]|nr:L-seryl-tRNA(Sec) selenium transferase [Planctomycetota bacterium]
MASQDRTAVTSPTTRETTSAYRSLPAVNEVVESAILAGWLARTPRNVVVDAVRAVLGEFRTELAGAGDTAVPTLDQFAERTVTMLQRQERPRLRPVINATGIILHTGLGRSPLADSVAAAVADVARQYSSLELDLETGERGKRTTIVRELLCQGTGAESATVVNNNAAATMIVLATVGKGRSIIVSRGELIEIGGSFRLPDIMQASGATLCEVGTTNKTRIGDYERAIDETTAGLMKVHTSNYRIVGFSESASLEELVALGRRRGLPVIDDIGSGALIDYSRFGFSDEPVAAASVQAGADLVLFSGDKLLGGPQAGIILGRRDWIDRIEKNPLMRAFRVDKMTLAALQVTLRLYRDPEQACREVPILAMIQTPVLELRNRAEKLAGRLRSLPRVAEVTVVNDTAYLGGGSIPTQGFPSVVVRLSFQGISETDVAACLRMGDPAVVPRVQDGRVIFDLRTVFESQLEELVAAVAAVG